ncbi:DUF3189 family protein [Orenia marismortui]|uniref:DUF3189 family protein n=1 Tax=Orenia marismortui TaxID=46469 RepID=UPI00036BBB36|nr:DUF3189 family protein [Orenia marismortui]
MKIIYYSQSDDFIAKLVACLYLKESNINLSIDKVIEVSFIKQVFERGISSKGLIFLGKDKYNHDVLALDCQKQGEIIKRMLYGVKRVFKLEEKILFINTDKCINKSIKVGRYLSDIGLNSIGFFFIKSGIKRSYKEIIKLLNYTTKKVDS